MREQLAQGHYVKRSGHDLNLRPICCKSDALTTTPHASTTYYIDNDCASIVHTL